MCYITVATSIFYTRSESKTIEINNLFSPELLKLSGYPGRFFGGGRKLVQVRRKLATAHRSLGHSYCKATMLTSESPYSCVLPRKVVI